MNCDAPMHPGRKALDRLLRHYIRHFRREFVREQRYLEVAARQALIGAAGQRVQPSNSGQRGAGFIGQDEGSIDYRL
jgi:hypothetical protein